MAETKIVANCETGEVEPVELTAEEEAALLELRAEDATRTGIETTETANEVEIRKRLETARSRLTTDVAAITASPPTLFGSLTANERRYLAALGRAELGLIRLQLRRLDAVE